MLRGLLCAVLLASAPDVEPLEPVPLAERDEARARAAWEKGSVAFGEGHFADAIGPFLEAYRYSGRPGVLFSLAQAHRHRWETDADIRQKQLAIVRYQQYLELDPSRVRGVEAERYIKELLAAQELEGLGDPIPDPTRVSLASTTPGATASIDGGATMTLPRALEVEPGKHRVVVSAPGFHSQTRTVDVPAGSTIPIDVALEIVEAQLFVSGPAGSDVFVDGERVGRVPHRDGIDVQPGPREVAVAKPGKALFVRDVDLQPGETRSIRADMERTGQRKVAYAALTVGGAGVAAAVVLAALAGSAQAKMAAFQRRRSNPDIVAEEREVAAYREAAQRRTTFRTAAIGSGVVGAAIVVVGVVLYFTDKPPVASRLKPTASAGRGGASFGLRGRF